MQLDGRTFRDTIGLFATGITIISAEHAGEIRGMTANSVTSVSLDPLLLLVCIDRRAHMLATITAAGRFGVSILRGDQEPISRHFAGRPDPDLHPAFTPLASTQRLSECMAAISCVTQQVLDGGDHVIVLAQVEAIWRADDPGAPLLYFAGKYRHLQALDA
ncbi:flavin reductase domain protein FMN-binding [Oscillochloris trichoides DG-6]|uniref:Flavin reductase domain protein FMN-binding n=1 Tax=Oscillochloris trichoides DG-6 TaxID=765420 RepID=E1IDQ1_9CHLR|nr:flavin reductase family protein [Oscillochloris trichoides]EFO80679.1 flavin reductase domain protein FMN-binding [Oscillochloris trichoides DG-6]